MRKITIFFLISVVFLTFVPEMSQKVLFTENLQHDLTQAVEEVGADRLFVLADEITAEKCWGRICHYDIFRNAHIITIPAGDTNKNIESTNHVWTELSQHGATRHSMMVNIGGGMVTDLGGFAASTFKRGIEFINIPTTLLAMVDASVGGKTGFNLGGLKNEIGVFRDARTVIIDTEFLRTLDDENMRSGYAEMLKHSLLADEKMWARHVTFDITEPDLKVLQEMVRESVAVKERIVTEDPHEKGLRKALNLGHTAGHALETWCMRRQPVLHGYAVAWGLVAELYLSAIKTDFPRDKFRQTEQFIRTYYGVAPTSCKDTAELLELMTHDKKNTAGEINFTLLGGIGDIRINQKATEKEIEESLDYASNPL